MFPFVTRFASISLVLLLAGCANAYLDAKRNTAPGGAQEQQLIAANQRLAVAQDRNQSLQDQKMQRDREIERNSRRISALESSLKTQEAQLAAALRARKVSKGQHDQLKRELDSLKAGTQQADLDNQGSAFSKKGVDPQKEAQLKALERRKKELEDTLAKLAGV